MKVAVTAQRSILLDRHMATLRLGASWSPPTTAAAASRSVRLIRGASHVHLPCRRGVSSALVKKMEACTRDALRTHCQMHADHLPEPEPEPEPEDDDPGTAAASPEDEDCELVKEFRRREKLFSAMMSRLGVHVAPDMFVQEKDQISKYQTKMYSSSHPRTLDEKVVAQTVCSTAQSALNLASEIMDITDITGLGLGRAEICQLTANQMIRTYGSMFCNIAEDAYHMKIETETILSFLGALRGLGAICHILVQDIAAKLKDGGLKNGITRHMDIQSRLFEKRMTYLEDEVAKLKAQKIAISALHSGLNCVRWYAAHLFECRETVLNHIQLKEE